MSSQSHGPPGHDEILASFATWTERPGFGPDRLSELITLTASDPRAWCEALVSLVPTELTDDFDGSLVWGVAACDRSSEVEGNPLGPWLAEQASTHRTIAAVIAYALSARYDLDVTDGTFRFLGDAAGALRAIDVLGDPLVFSTWSRGSQEGRDVDGWAEELFRRVVRGDPDACWRTFLRFLAFEEDEGVRGYAAISWLESINFQHSEEFIDRIEAEARINPRLRAAMRSTYPPGTPDVEERYERAREEPDDADG